MQAHNPNPELIFFMSSLLSSGMLMLFSSGLLFILNKKFKNATYQVYWGYAWLMFGIYILMGAASLSLRMSGHKSADVLNTLTFASQFSGYLGPTLLYLGCQAMIGKPINARVIALWVLGIFAVSASLAFYAYFPDSSVFRYVTRVGIRSLYALLLLSFVAYKTLIFFKDKEMKGPRIFAYSMFAYALSWIFYIIAAIDMIMGGTFYRHLSAFGLITVFIHASVMYGFVIWAIESEYKKVKEAENQLKEQAWRDSLTGLYNRRWLEYQCTDWLNKKLPKTATISVMFIDLDGFKNVNDTYGHKVGDELLVEVSKALSRQRKGSDVLCRLGGDEFVFIYTDHTRSESVYGAANAIRENIQSITKIQAHNINISCSIGIASASPSWEVSTLTQSSDKAMYAAKSEGKNNIKFAKTSPSQSIFSKEPQPA